MYLNCAVLFSGDGIKWLKGKQEQKEIYSSAMGTWGMTAWQAISYMNVQAVEEMIVKHQGVSIVSGKKVTGYAVSLDGKAYIFHENGSRVQVRESTIIPVQDGVVDAMELMQDGGGQAFPVLSGAKRADDGRIKGKWRKIPGRPGGMEGGGLSEGQGAWGTEESKDTGKA